MVCVWVGVDESGDLGFDFGRRGTTEFLVISYVFTRDVFSVRKVMRRVWRRLVRRRLWPKEVPELKFTLSRARAERMGLGGSVLERTLKNIRSTRREVLKVINGLGLDLSVSIVHKPSVTEDLRHRPEVLYNYVFAHPFVTRFLERYNPPPFSSVTVLLDKRVGGRAEKSLKEYVRNKYEYMRDHQLRVSYNVRITVEQVNSEREPLIWVADYVAGSVYTLFQHGDDSYVSIIKERFFDCAYFWAGPKECYDKLGIRP